MAHVSGVLPLSSSYWKQLSLIDSRVRFASTEIERDFEVTMGMKR